jgi:D-glycero-D-manno-heptose 1,7-bisphosphate phosphatase
MTHFLEHKIVIQQPFEKPRPALFLDRDGVLIEDRHYLCKPEEVSLCLGAYMLLVQAASRQCPVVVVTNQSGIFRGIFDWDAYRDVTNRMLEILGAAAPLAALYANGHGPDAAPSSWRKPSPAMLIEAAADLNLDLSRSLLIGDRLTDLKAGAAAGLKHLTHVLTGHGQKERSSVTAWAAKERPQCRSGISLEVDLIDSLCDFPLDYLICH